MTDNATRSGSTAPAANTPSGDQAGLERIRPALACPHCHGALRWAPACAQCTSCGGAFPLRDGIPLFTPPRADEGAADPGNYAENYQTLARAARYNEKYQTQLFKRWSTEREFRLLQSLFAKVGHSAIVLDLPCGGGRLTPAFASFADAIIEADIGLGQVQYGRQTSSVRTPQVWMTASAFTIPLRNDGVDGTVCCRLSHHLKTPREREDLLRELLRVSRRFVIMTYFDYDSVKNVLRRARRIIDGNTPKRTLRTARVAELAREGGGRLVAQPSLSLLFSGHRYALIVKGPA